MVCTDRVVVATGRLDLKDVDEDVLEAALKLMFPTANLDIVRSPAWSDIEMDVRMRGELTRVVIRGRGGVDFIGPQARRLERDMEQFYLAAARLAALQAEGFQAEAEVEGETIRIYARG